jgi:hypothetical protein
LALKKKFLTSRREEGSLQVREGERDDMAGGDQVGRRERTYDKGRNFSEPVSAKL